ncbi:oligosaccharide flippase family protein [Dietzia maris]|uniref:oligosaccharide flippase family protein n=1 Tax=Dietzia maris TaxID=37915 RepID=UPI0037C4F640
MSKSVPPFARSIIIRLTSAIVTFALGVVLARVLTPSELGKYGILFSIMSVLGLPLSTGIPNFLTQHIPKLSSASTRRREIYRASMFTAVLGVLYISLGVGLTLTEASLADWEWGWLVVLGVAPLMGLDLIRGGGMAGLGLPNLSQIPAFIVRPFVALVVLATFIYFGAPASLGLALASYAAGCLVSLVVGHCLLLMVLNRQDATRLDADGSSDEPHTTFGQLARTIASFSLFGLAGTLTGNIDMLILNQVGDFSGAGSYRVALQGVAVIVLGHNAIGAVTYVQLAQSAAGRAAEDIAAVSDKSVLWQFVTTLPFIMAAILLGKPLINILFGAEYSLAYSFLVILSVGHIATISVGPSSHLVLLANRQLVGATISLLAVMITFVVAMFLYGSIGPVAVAYASAAGAWVRALGYWHIARATFGVDPSVYGLVKRRISASRRKIGDERESPRA